MDVTFRQTGSHIDFFNSGVMNAALVCDDNIPDDSNLHFEQFSGEWRQHVLPLSFKRLVGSGSVVHCLCGISRMVLLNSQVWIATCRGDRYRPIRSSVRT